MKMIVRHAAVILGCALTAASCVQPFGPGNGQTEGSFGVEISVRCAETTKAGPVPWPGEDVYNEKRVDRVDWFLFRSDTDSGTALKHGRTSITSGTADLLFVERLGLDDYVTDSQRTFYIYAVANLPETAHDNLPLTLAGLKAVGLTAAFNSHSFTPQTHFVMRGGATFTFENTDLGQTKKITVPLSRVAAKVSFKMNVTPAIDQLNTEPDGDRVYVQTWYPDLASIQAFLCFANSVTDLKASPRTYDMSSFFTYEGGHFQPAYNYPGNPAEASGTLPSVTPDWNDSAWKWNVSGTPFYSYPMAWTPDSPQAPFIKIILKWTPRTETPPHTAPYYDSNGKFLRARRDFAAAGTSEKTREFYYKIPLYTDSGTLEANQWYDLTFNVSILGGTADELPVELGGQYYVVDWSNPDISAGGNLKQGRYLSTASDIYYIYGKNDIEIPVTSSHQIAVKTTGVSFTDYSAELPTSFSGSAGLNHFPFNVSNPDRKVSVSTQGRERIVFSHPLIDIIHAGTGNRKPDVSEYRFAVLIYHKDLYPSVVPSENSPYAKRITIVQQPTLRIENELNSDYHSSNHNANNGHVFVNGYDNSQYGVNSQYGRVHGLTGNNKNPNMYVISTSVAPDAYVIADTRSPDINHLEGSDYSWTADGDRIGAHGYNHKLRHYYPSHDADSERNKIAPKIRIASSYGVTNPLSSFRNARRRCATYQEDGIPAGRWRIPTRAEINFMISLTEYAVIPVLFSDNTWYFCADGGCIRRKNGVIENSYTMPSENKYVRCVYDEWYWGTEDRLPAGSSRGRFTWGCREIQ